MIRIVIIGLAITFPLSSLAAEFDCAVEQKFEVAGINSELVKTYDYSVRIMEPSSGRTYLSLCDRTNQCESFKVDKVKEDKKVKVKKYYVYDHQVDVQLFPNMAFVANNGRGSITFGKCTLSAP